MNVVSKKSYGQYSSENYGNHTQVISIGALEFYFSYDTIVAFNDENGNLVVTENVWGSTTGKHLNWINPNKTDRLKHSDFQEKLIACLRRHNLKLEQWN